MIKIAIITTTRAEYGLLSPVIKELRKYESDDLKVELIVTGTHLCSEYGMTVNEIEDRIDKKIKILFKDSSAIDISRNQAQALLMFTELFVNESYSAVILLGDRYETLAIAVAAGNTRTPIFHMCGGDTTEGAMDEWIRHSITKISYLHFVTNEISRKRVEQLGEDPDRIFNYGSTSIDNILSVATMKKAEALESIGMCECRYALCTYHPVTMEDECVDNQILELLEAFSEYPEIQFIVTKANADRGGSRINELFDQAAKQNLQLHVFASLGVRKYLSLMKHAEFVIGNSSSGIVESPALHVPTVNIGNRQKGRLQSPSVINCEMNRNEIVLAIRKALSKEHRQITERTASPYGTGDTGRRIAEKTIETVLSGNIDLKKRFHEVQTIH